MLPRTDDGQIDNKALDTHSKWIVYQAVNWNGTKTWSALAPSSDYKNDTYDRKTLADAMDWIYQPSKRPAKKKGCGE